MWVREKPYELRRDDRDFAVGDTLDLREFDPETGTYSGRSILALVAHVLRDVPHFGLMPGYCLMLITPHRFSTGAGK
jgi:hypothetical protein